MKKFSKNQLQRYPIYLKYFKGLYDEGVEDISSPKIAKALGYSEEQIRKDLQAVSDDAGRPKKGRSVIKLIETIESFLGYRGSMKSFMIGVGHLGAALMNYPNFAEMGLSIVAGFDVDKSKVGATVAGKPVYRLEELPQKMRESHCQIAILAVPVGVAQEVADFCVASGILGIWNFAPTHIDVPNNVIIENVNLASSLAVLNHRLNESLEKKR
jgi:redox-sensing transcriptional repressor